MDIYNQIYSIEGVRNIDNLKIQNIYNDGVNNLNYSDKIYTINSINGIIYPPKDPSIFELKYPDSDIIGNLIIVD